MIENDITTVSVWGGTGHRARCELGVEPYSEGRPRCDNPGSGSRPRCEHLVIMWAHLDLAVRGLWMLGCICGVSVGGEYFNYACRLLPFQNFFAHYFCAKPLLTVQKMSNRPNLAHRGGRLPLFCPNNTPMEFELIEFW